MEKYLIYKKDGAIDKSQDFIHESCFGSDNSEEILEKFHKEGFEAEIVDRETFLNLVNDETAEEKINRLKNQIISSRKKYLFDTDWYVMREADQAQSYPMEIKNKRSQAREEINAAQSSGNLQEIESFDVDFK